MSIRTDHFKHFFVCFMVSALGTVPWQIWHEGWMLALPVALGLLAGFCKEFADIGEAALIVRNRKCRVRRVTCTQVGCTSAT